MKRVPFYFFLCLFVLNAALDLDAQALPRPTGFVNDFARVMRPEDVRSIETLAAAVQQRTGAQIAVVTVESYAPFGSLDEFSMALAESWGVGQRREEQGVILVLAMTERRVRIEVGYGLEGAIPDSVAGRILDTDVIPAFQAGNFSRGLTQGANSIAAIIAREHGIDPAVFNVRPAPQQPAHGTPAAGIGGLIPLILLFLFVRGRMFPFLLMGGMMRRRRGFGSGSFGGGFSGGGFRGGGGFGGFGGGGFGGGGASRGF